MKLEDSKAVRYINSTSSEDCDFDKIDKLLQEEFPGYNVIAVDADEISDEEKEEIIVNCIQNKCLADFQSGMFETNDCELVVKIICILTKED